MRISDWSSDVCSSDLGSVEWRLPWFDTKVIGSNLHAPNKVGSQDFDVSPMPIAAFYTNGQFADYKTWCYVRHHLSLNRRLQPAVRQGQFLHSSQTSAGHRRRKIGRYSFALVESSQAFHGYQKRPAYETHGICDRFPR